MGRNLTGIATTDQSLRLELSFLLKQGCLKKNHSFNGTIKWFKDSNPNLGEIKYQTLITEAEAWIRLMYDATDLKTGVKTQHDYKIYLESIKSNLGKGDLLYFICPVNGKRCRILYSAYGSPIWKSREAYTHRIYYSCQSSSKFNYSDTRYWDIDSKQEKAYQRFRDRFEKRVF